MTLKPLFVDRYDSAYENRGEVSTMPQPTDRPQNYCDNCGNTWYPRGRNRSRKCPACGSGRVGIFVDEYDSPAPASSGCAWTAGTIAAVVLGSCVVVGLLGVFLKPQKPREGGAPDDVGQGAAVAPFPPANAVPAGEPKEPRLPSNFKVGDTIDLTNTIGHVPLGMTADIYRAYRQANESARIDHYRREEVITVPVPATAEVLEVSGDLFKVRVLDGYHKDKIGFIDSRDAQRR